MKTDTVHFEFEPQSVLDYCLKYGIVDYDDAIMHMKDAKIRKHVAKVHRYAITQEKCDCQ